MAVITSFDIKKREKQIKYERAVLKEISLKELYRVKHSDYYGIETPKDPDYVRTKVVKRFVEYPNNQSGFDKTTLNYEYADCHYENGIIDTRQSEDYDEWPHEHLKLRTISLYDMNGYEKNYQHYMYNDEGEIDRSIELSYECDEEGHIINIRKKDSDEGPKTIYSEIVRDLNENGQTVWHEIDIDGKDGGRCEYEYDIKNRLAKKSYRSDGYSEQFEYIYDEDGRLLEYTCIENGNTKQDVSFRYIDEYHRVEEYDELGDPSHCSALKVYQFDSKGTLVYERGNLDTILYCCDRNANIIREEKYSGDELQCIIYRSYDEDTGLLRSQSAVSSLDKNKQSALAYAFAYENTRTGDTFDYSDIDEVIDLQLNIENILCPDFWDTLLLDFSENYNTGSEIVATDISKYREALECADKLSEPKVLPPYGERLLHDPVLKKAVSETADSWVGTWEAQAYSGGVVTLNIMSDNTYTIKGAFPKYEWNDSGVSVGPF